MLKKLTDKKVLAAILAALITIFAVIPWSTGVKYACLAQKALGGEVNAECVADEPAQ